MSGNYGALNYYDVEMKCDDVLIVHCKQHINQVNMQYSITVHTNKILLQGTVHMAN